MATKFLESTAGVGEDLLGMTLDLVTDAPYALLTIEPIQDSDGLTEEEKELASGFKVVARIGNGISDRNTVRVLLQKALDSIPE